jgi:hypothetical protein
MGCRRDSRHALDVLFVGVLFVVVLFFVVILVELVSILRLFVLIVLIVVIGNGIHLDRMDLNDFHLGFALGAGEDFAFFHFIFVDVNLGSAFGAANHGENLLRTNRATYC